MSASGGRRRLSRLFRWLLPGALGAETCDVMDRRRDELRAGRGGAVAWLWHAAHLLHPQTWVLAVLLRRRQAGYRRGRWGFGVSWLDVKLGVRMMRRNPGLTVVAVLALSIGIPASLIPIHAIDVASAPLPFDQGDRIVGIRNRNVASGRTEARSLHDFFVWRDELTTFEAVAAARNDVYNVISDDGRVAPVLGAEITASGLQLLRVPPLLGRLLAEADEVHGGPDVVVLSYELWQSRMGGDPDVLGKTIALGGKPYEVVGVMPEGFLFPWRNLLWLPFRYRPTDFERGGGPSLTVFGRLADGASIDEAGAELRTVGARLASEYPDTDARLRPQVSGYTEMAMGGNLGDRTDLYLIELIALALLMIVCGNVGTLILARTAARSGEIAVRTALGASRSRIVSQLFVEALVLAVGAAGVGLVLADFLATRFQNALPIEAPFWLDLGVKPRSVALALSVAALCAVVAGVLPALRATGRRFGVSLQGVAARSGMRFGRTSTFLIVAEVAMAVGFFTVGGTLTYALLANGPPASEIDPDEYLLVEVSIPRTDLGSAKLQARAQEFRQHLNAVVTGLRDRLSAEPGVGGVAMGSRLPEMEHPARRVEVEGEEQGEGFDGHRIRVASVQVGFFQSLGRFDPEFRNRHIEVHFPGDLVAVDTFFVGTLKGVGKVYLQAVLDCFSRHGWGRLYTSKLPLTVVQVLNNEVLPFSRSMASVSARFSQTMDASLADGPTGIRMSSPSNSTRSSTARPRCGGASPMASSNTSIAPCSMSIFGRRGAPPGTKPSTRCRPISTPTS